MGFRTSKFMTGMKSKKAFKTLSVAALAGVTSMGMAQAQSPEVIMAPIPQVGNEFGNVNNQTTEFYPLEKIDIFGKTWVMDGRYIDLAESRGELPQEYLDALNRQDYLKYYYDNAENTIKVKNIGGQGYDVEITQDFINEYSEGGSGGFAIVLRPPHSLDSNLSDIKGGVGNGTYMEEVSVNFVNSYYEGGSAGMIYSAMDNAKILNEGEIGTVDATIVGTYGIAGGSGGFAFEPIVENNGLVDTLRGDFVANAGSAILNTGTIGEVNVDVIGNGTANFNIVNSVGLQQGDIVISGPQVINFGKIEKGIINSNFINNENHFYVYNEEVKTNLTKLFDKDWAYLNEYFQGGTALLELHMLATPPAVLTMTDLTVGAENGGTSVFSGNKGVVYDYSQIDRQQMQQNPYNIENVSKLGETTDAIFVMPNIYASQAEVVQPEPPEKTTLTLSAQTGGKLVMNDNINGFHYNLDVTGDETGAVYLNNNVKSYDIDIETGYINSDKGVVDVSLEKTNLILGRGADVLDGHNLTLNSGALSMLNGEVGQMSLNQLNVAGDTKFYGDVDLANAQMDRVTADEYSGDADIVVAGLNLLSDAKTDTTEILFADYELKDNVRSDVTTTENNLFQSTAYSPIFRYDVKYSEKDDGGYFEFSKHVAPQGGGSAPSTPSVESFNPAVLGSSSTATVGATATMNQAFNYAFQHSSDHMNIPYLERISMRDRNKYALSITGDATDMGRFSPLYQPSDEGASVWVKPYATFETVGLKNGPKVHNNTYGTLIGFDTEMQSIKRGWDRVFTGYIGYNGASQRYSGIDSTQNGGLLGGTMTLYKGNFFNATTVSVGASVANNQTMYGNEDFAMLLSGIGNKTGYNFEFKEGKLILQPSMLMSYTFVNTFDYTNAAGVRIDNKPLHALQLAPGVKVIGNLKGGWQPYASVQMVWNLMGESNATANGVKLPEMSIKPYVQYGVGVQKRIKDHFTAYGQAMVQNGGRNGISLTAGFRWALGHDNCKYKVEAKQLRGKAAKSKCHSELDSESINANKTLSPTLSVGEGAKNEILRSAQNDGSRKILKQMTPEQKMAHGGKYYNTSRTAKTGSLRQY